jgi:CDP-diacylglycerol--serine O-phosphatidyltransferase
MLNTPRRLAFFLPNTFTALNMACGFYSIILSFNHEFYPAAMILVLGAIFDSVDGRVARMTGTQSAFGEQFDSISDVVTFGVAPAILAYNKFFSDLGRIGLITAFVFLLCGALRLARFNANIEKVSSDFFQGLPIPSGALAIVGLVLFAVKFPEFDVHPIVYIIYVLFFAFLMISNIPFNSFKKSEWVRKHKKRALLMIFVVIILTFTYEYIMIGLILLTYVAASLAYYFKHRTELENLFQWSSEFDEEEHH